MALGGGGNKRTSSYDTIKMQFETTGEQEFASKVSKVQAFAEGVVSKVSQGFQSIETDLEGIVDSFKQKFVNFDNYLTEEINLTQKELSRWSEEFLYEPFSRMREYFVNSLDVSVNYLKEKVADYKSFLSEEYFYFSEKIKDIYYEVSDGIEAVADKTIVGVKYNLSAVADYLRENYPRVYDGIITASNFVVEHFNIQKERIFNFVQSTKKFFGQIIDNVSMYKKKATDFFMSTSNFFDEQMQRLVQGNENIAKMLEGPFLVAKLTVLSLTKAIINIPKIAVASYNKVKEVFAAIDDRIFKPIRDFKRRVTNTVEGIKNKFQEMIQGTKDWANSLWESTKSFARFYGKVTGITPLFNFMKKSTTWTFKVVGLTAALGAIKGLIFGSEQQASPLISMLSDTFNAMLAPVEQIMYDIGIVLVPMIAKTVLPIVTAVVVILENIFEILDKVVFGSDAFSKTLTTIIDILVKVGMMMTQIVMGLLEELLPIILPIIQFLVEEISNIVKEILPIILSVFKEFMPVLVSLFKEIMPILKLIVPLVKQLLPVFSELIKLAASTIAEMVKELIPALLPAIKQLIESVIDLAIVLLPVIVEIVKALSWVLKAVASPIISFAIKALSSTVSYAISGITKLIGWIVIGFEKLVSTIDLVVEKIGSFINWIFGGIKSAWFAVRDFFITEIAMMLEETGILDLLTGKVSGIMDTIVKVVLAPIKLMKHYINKFIVAPIMSILNWKPPFLKKSLLDLLEMQNKPKFLKEGGIVTKPTLAVIGEEGEEAVIPLEKGKVEQFIPETIREPFPEKITTSFGEKIYLELQKIRDEVSKKGIEPMARETITKLPQIKFSLNGMITE